MILSKQLKNIWATFVRKFVAITLKIFQSGHTGHRPNPFCASPITLSIKSRRNKNVNSQIGFRPRESDKNLAKIFYTITTVKWDVKFAAFTSSTSSDVANICTVNMCWSNNVKVPHCMQCDIIRVIQYCY